LEIFTGYDNLARHILIYVNARDESCDDNYVWCEKKVPKRAVGAEYPWSIYDPDDFMGNENCVAFFINGRRGSLGDVPCHLKLYSICEVKHYFLKSKKINDNDICRVKKTLK